MPPAASNIVCHDVITVLDSDLTLSDGSVIPAGSTILLLPKTISDCVLVNGTESLTDVINTISNSLLEEQINMVNFNVELITYSNRLVAVESKTASS